MTHPCFELLEPIIKKIDHENQLPNFLLNRRKKSANKAMRRVHDLSINNILCTPYITTSKHRLEGFSHKKILLF